MNRLMTTALVMAAALALVSAAMAGGDNNCYRHDWSYGGGASGPTVSDLLVQQQDQDQDRDRDGSCDGSCGGVCDGDCGGDGPFGPAESGYGPGDGTGYDGDGPQDGSGYGPGGDE